MITMRKHRIDNDVDSIGATLTLYTTIRSARMKEPWMMMMFITHYIVFFLYYDQYPHKRSF